MATKRYTFRNGDGIPRCQRCRTPLTGTIWTDSRPARRLTLTGEIQQTTVTTYYCDDCGKLLDLRK